MEFASSTFFLLSFVETLEAPVREASNDLLSARRLGDCAPVIIQIRGIAFEVTGL